MASTDFGHQQRKNFHHHSFIFVAKGYRCNLYSVETLQLQNTNFVVLAIIIRRAGTLMNLIFLGYCDMITITA